MQEKEMLAITCPIKTEMFEPAPNPRRPAPNARQLRVHLRVHLTPLTGAITAADPAP
jgi:hypothetical protein